ncbi:MAG: hypothetical protein RL647_14, partial [Bacteroidota bacterium]
MNLKFTKSKLIALVLGLTGWMSQSEAQICGATNSLNCTGDYLSAISFKNSAGTSYAVSGMNCANTGSSNKLMTNGAVMDITPGEDISMTIENTCSFSEYAGVWIDLDGDNTFSAAECIAKANSQFGLIPVNTTRTATLTIPCTGVKAGKAIMRVRCMYSTFTPSQGCGTISNYGNILDFEVNIKAVNPPSADFAVPTGPNFTKTPITFNSTATNSAYAQTW